MTERAKRAAPWGVSERGLKQLIVNFAEKQPHYAEWILGVFQRIAELEAEVARLKAAHNGEVCVDVQDYCDKLETENARLRDAGNRVVNDAAGHGAGLYRVGIASLDALRDTLN